MTKKLSRRDFLKVTGVTSASLIFSACGMKVSELPTATSLPLTNTPFPTNTLVPTSTPVPTLAGLSIAVPDPRVSNPELFDLSKTDSFIPQFANALNTAGIELTPEQVDQKIEYQDFKDNSGNPFVVAIYKIDHESIQQTEFLDKPIPLLTAIQSKETKGWKWSEATPSNLGEKLGILIGTVAQPPGSMTNAESFHRLKENRFNGSITVTDVWMNREKQEGVKNWGYIDTEIGEAFDLETGVIRINHLISNDAIPDWLSSKNKAEIETLSQEHIQEHMRYIYEKIEKECITRGIDKFTIEFNVVNEIWHSSLFSQKSGGRDKFVLLSCQKAVEVKNAILHEKKSESPNIQIKLGLSHANSHYIGGEGYEQLHELLVMLENNNLHVDYVDLHGHEKDVLALPNTRLIDGAIRSFSKYKNLNGESIGVIIGEYDLNIMKWEKDHQRFLKQAERYYNVFSVSLNAGVKEITLWGVADDESWYADKEDKNVDSGYYSLNADALVFDDSGKPKLDYYAILASIRYPLKS